MSDQILRPITTCNPWQKIKLRDKHTGQWQAGYVVIGHDLGIRQKVALSGREVNDFELYKVPGSTVVGMQGQYQNRSGWKFYQIKSTAMVELDI